MSVYLGLDTSNYTTSFAVFDTHTLSAVQSKKLLKVKDGELGLRQSDAVFQHIKQISSIVKDTHFSGNEQLAAVGVSVRPRNLAGSYMPCFLVGEAVADCIGHINSVPVHKTSHQIGHILAALYSCKRLDLTASDKPFLAFHVSGGTTDCLKICKDPQNIISIEEIGTSLDLKAGQLIDRVGVMLGLSFPCGAELEKMAKQSDADISVKPRLKNGSCCLSGIENKCRDMFLHGEKPCDIALFVLKNIEAVITAMTESAISIHGDMPIVFAGGVMSDKLIRYELEKRFESYFSEPEYSCDNALGTAIYAALKDGFTV